MKNNLAIFWQKLKPGLKYGHLVIFAVLPLLNFFMINSEELSLTDHEIGIFLIFNLVVLVLAIILSALLLRNWPKAALVSTLLVIQFFLYGHLAEALPGPSQLVALIYAILAIALLLMLRKMGRPNVIKFNKVLTGLGAVFVVTSLAAGVPKLINQAQSFDAKLDQTSGAQSTSVEKPDIYYIVLDSYPRNDVLKTTFNYDNNSFTKALEDKGFYVADKSVSNYAFTALSIPSTLNMAYLDFSSQPVKRSFGSGPLNIKDNKATAAFGELGYEFIHIGTGWSGSQTLDEIADIKLESPDDKMINLLGLDIELNEFLTVYTRNTAIRSLVDKKIKTGLANLILDAFHNIERIPDIEEPTFSFIHLHVPHPPYVFDRNGITDSQELELTGDVLKARQPFLEQLIFVNKLTMETVDGILERSEKPPIIVLASDHGSATVLGHPEKWGLPTDKNAAGVKERMANLTAYYFPDADYANLYPEISPVNSFPTILNQYFGGNYDTYPDKAYFSNYDERDRLFDVTSLIKD